MLSSSVSSLLRQTVPLDFSSIKKSIQDSLNCDENGQPKLLSFFERTFKKQPNNSIQVQTSSNPVTFCEHLTPFMMQQKIGLDYIQALPAITLARLPLFDDACDAYSDLVKGAIVSVMKDGTFEEQLKVYDHILASAKQPDLTATVKASYEKIAKSLTLSETFIQKKCLTVLSRCTKGVTEQIRYSKSGAIFHIDRPIVGVYQPVNPDSFIEQIYEKIDAAMGAYRYIDSFQMMLNHNVGDCAPQSLLLGMILKKIDIVNKYYVILQTDNGEGLIGQDLCLYTHTFLTLIARNSSFLKKHPALNKPQVTKLKGNLLQNNKDIIMVDSWRHLIFNGDMPITEHPFNYQPFFSFGDTVWEFCNLDHLYLETQKAFPSLVEKNPVLRALVHPNQ